MMQLAAASRRACEILAKWRTRAADADSALAQLELCKAMEQAMQEAAQQLQAACGGS